MRKNLAFLLFPFISLLQFFLCVLDALLKKKNLLICACLLFDDYSLFVNANHYYPDQKLRHGEEIFYWRTNIDTFNHLFFWSNLNFHTFQLFLENRATSNHLENKMSLNCIYRISSNKSPHSNKHPPSDKHPLPWPTYQKTTPLPTSNKRLPLASLPSLDNRDTKKTCCYWHLICNFINFNYS